MICPPRFPTDPFMHTHLSASFKPFLILQKIMHAGQVGGTGGFSAGQLIEYPGVVLLLTAYIGGDAKRSLVHSTHSYNASG
jgi:hypothetical protein